MIGGQLQQPFREGDPVSAGKLDAMRRALAAGDAGGASFADSTGIYRRAARGQDIELWEVYSCELDAESHEYKVEAYPVACDDNGTWRTNTAADLETLWSPAADHDEAPPYGAVGPPPFAKRQRVYSRLLDGRRCILTRSAFQYTAWAKVQSGHVNYAFGTPSRTASVKLLDEDGNEYGDAFPVHLPVAKGKHPALFAGDKIVVCNTVAGVPASGQDEPVCLSDCSDDAFFTVKAFGGSVANIPPGWALCDGTNGTTCDLRGRFIMGVDPDGADDEKAIGQTGGYRKHGETENNHNGHGAHSVDDHAAHNDAAHDETPQFTLAPYDAGGQQVMVSVEVAHGAATDWSHAQHNLQGTHNAHSDTDNRPRYYVLAYMQRVA